MVRVFARARVASSSCRPRAADRARIPRTLAPAGRGFIVQGVPAGVRQARARCVDLCKKFSSCQVTSPNINLSSWSSHAKLIHSCSMTKAAVVDVNRWSTNHQSLDSLMGTSSVSVVIVLTTGRPGSNCQTGRGSSQTGNGSARQIVGSLCELLQRERRLRGRMATRLNCSGTDPGRSCR